MDILCPTCGADYEIDDASVGESGRKVRCASCGTVWRVFRGGLADQAYGVEAPPAPPPQETSPPLETPPVNADADLPIAAPPELPAPAPRRVKWAKEPKPKKPPSGFRRALTAPATGIVLVTAIVVGGAIHQRARIVDHLPQAAPLYAAIGLPVNLRGIAISNIASRIIEDNGTSILVVDGDLKNITNGQIDVPRLRFAIRDPRGQEIYIWSAQPDRTKLQPGETLNFRRRLASPPGDGKDVSVRFVTKADITAGIR